jgi:RNA polymerase subunit RPABC4/transcription elongation factor Spt4
MVMTTYSKLSEPARTALQACYATRGKHKGQLLAKCPPSSSMAAAAWQGAMIVCNPYKASIASMLFMSSEQRAVRDEIMAHFESLPREYMILAQRDRQALESLGVW